MKIVVDKAGRVVLPIPIRRQFHLGAGSVLDLQVAPGGIVLRPQEQVPMLAEERGVLVHDGEKTGDMLDAVAEARARRDRSVSGLGA